MLTLPKVTDQIGRYKLLSELGRGSIGQVYLALDPNIDRYVALKVCLPLLKVGAKERIELRRRFILEAKAAGRVRHPGIVTIFDADTDPVNDLSYIAMEWVDGHSLQDYLAENGPMDPTATVQLIEQVALALDAAHREGLVHRDVKPGNILCGKDGTIKVTDFGIAKVASMSITQSSWIPGSPFYMSPEQVRNEQVDGRTDIYSLGAVLYECLTGSVPFEGDSLASLTYMILDIDPRPPQTIEPSLADDVAQIAMRALAKSPSHRFQSAVDMVRALRATDAYRKGERASSYQTRPFEVLSAVEPKPPVSTPTPAPFPTPAFVEPAPAGEAPPQDEEGNETIVTPPVAGRAFARKHRLSPAWLVAVLLAVAGAALALRAAPWASTAEPAAQETIERATWVERARPFGDAPVEQSLDPALMDRVEVPPEAEEVEATQAVEPEAVPRPRWTRPRTRSQAPPPVRSIPPVAAPAKPAVEAPAPAETVTDLDEIVEEAAAEPESVIEVLPVADASLEIVFRNRLKSGSITVTVDEAKVWTQSFTGANNFLKRSFGRDVWTTVPIHSGARVIDVRVSGTEGKIDLVRRAEGSFRAGETRRLRVIYTPPNRLRLSWKDEDG